MRVGGKDVEEEKKKEMMLKGEGKLKKVKGKEKSA